MESSSLVKALRLLEATAADAQGRSLAALAAEGGLAKPTAHRILKALTALGYLERNGVGVYRQTSQVHRLVASNHTSRLLAAAETVLRRLHRRTQETINLGVLRSDQIAYLQVLESPQPLRRVATANSMDPFHSTALGRAIVSQLSATQQQELLSQVRFEKRTAYTKADRHTIEVLLRQAAADGYALEVDETDLGVTCVGAPVFDQGAVVAAISISVPTVRTTNDALPKLIALVRQAAREITHNLGHGPKTAKAKLIKRSTHP